jgi:nucleoid-associated protein YgaU
LRAETKLVLDRVQLNEAARVLPDEYSVVVAALESADALHQGGHYDAAERAYVLAYAKAKVLEDHLATEQLQRAQNAQSRTEAELLAVARQRALLDDQRRLASEEEQQNTAAAESSSQPAGPVEDVKPRVKERQLLASYTVKRGESLPQIASRPEVYADSQLWPLLYRSNRDQISDPRRIWPGQVLRIPRNVGQDDIAEARRFAQKSSYF